MSVSNNPLIKVLKDVSESIKIDPYYDPNDDGADRAHGLSSCLFSLNGVEADASCLVDSGLLGLLLLCFGAQFHKSLTVCLAIINSSYFVFKRTQIYAISQIYFGARVIWSRSLSYHSNGHVEKSLITKLRYLQNASYLKLSLNCSLQVTHNFVKFLTIGVRVTVRLPIERILIV